MLQFAQTSATSCNDTETQMSMKTDFPVSAVLPIISTSSSMTFTLEKNLPKNYVKSLLPKCRITISTFSAIFGA